MFTFRGGEFHSFYLNYYGKFVGRDHHITLYVGSRHDNGDCHSYSTREWERRYYRTFSGPRVSCVSVVGQESRREVRR